MGLIRSNSLSHGKEAQTAALVLVSGLQFAVRVGRSATGTGQNVFELGSISQLELSKICARLKAARAEGVIPAERAECFRTLSRHANRNSAALDVNRKCKATRLILARIASTMPASDG